MWEIPNKGLGPCWTNRANTQCLRADRGDADRGDDRGEVPRGDGEPRGDALRGDALGWEQNVERNMIVMHMYTPN